jgi:hypothetical protein
VYAKRQEPSADPAASSKILDECDNAASRVSSACSCILSTTSTVTVTETATATEGAEVTATTTETVTVGAVATESAAPTYTVPAQPIVNGNFESWSTVPRNILPWTNTSATTGGKVEGIYGVNPCSSNPTYCAGGASVIRVYPPTTGGGYTSIVQDPFVAKPSTTYSVSFMVRCLNFASTSGVDVYYKGSRVGGMLCENLGAAFQHVTSGIQFTTDATGAGSLEFRFLNPTNMPYLYYYADDFQANAV